MNQFFGFVGQQFEKLSNVFFTGGCFNIVNYVELDVAGGQDFQDASRLASIGVVVDGHIRHGWGLLE